jgi:hypothetical protein
VRYDRTQLLQLPVCFWILKVRKWQRSEGSTRTQLLAPFFTGTDHKLTGQQHHVVVRSGYLSSPPINYIMEILNARVVVSLIMGLTVRNVGLFSAWLLWLKPSCAAPDVSRHGHVPLLTSPLTALERRMAHPLAACWTTRFRPLEDVCLSSA